MVNTNTLQFLTQKGEPHHLVFVDPPFRKGLLEETLTLLESNGWLADEALVYVESEVENGHPPVPLNWQLHREKSPVRWPVACTFVIRTMRITQMLINAGRLLMVFVWAFLLLNVVHPFPKPLTYFVNVALFFMVIMHGLQLVLMRTTQPQGSDKLSGLTQAKIFSLAYLSCSPGRKSTFPGSNSPQPVISI